MLPLAKWHRLEFIRPTDHMLAHRPMILQSVVVRIVRDQVQLAEVIMWLRDLRFIAKGLIMRCVMVMHRRGGGISWDENERSEVKGELGMLWCHEVVA